MQRRPQFEPLARLAAAGCGLSGPRGSRWVGFVLPYADAGALCLALVHLLQPCCAAAALPPVRVWVGCAIGFGVGAWTLLCVGAFNLPGVAAAALPPVRIWVGCASCAWRRFPFINNSPL